MGRIFQRKNKEQLKRNIPKEIGKIKRKIYVHLMT